jgi:LCP family protein required for cell wall assembly
MSPAGGDKPYRVYRGGRVKGKVPSLSREGRQGGPRRDGRFRLPTARKGPGRRPPTGRAVPKKRRYGRWILTTVGVLVLLLIIWGIASYFSFRSGVQAANKRLPKSAKNALTHQNGLLLSHPANILVLGTDHSSIAARAGDRHSDSIMIIHTDPSDHQLVYVSVMRDLQVEVPGHGLQKINAGYEFGGPSLEIQTVEHATGLPINHVVIVDFNRFKDLIDALGGITINVPENIRSKFDCPYPNQPTKIEKKTCATWQGWYFKKGVHHFDGRKALVYSRVRENLLNPADTDATRVLHQQQVMQAITSDLTSPWTLFKLPFIGGGLMKPTATDLSAGQLVQLAWVKFRAGTPWRCRLGLTQDERFYWVLRFIKNKRNAPQPPDFHDPYSSGCVHGNWPSK